MALVPPPDQLRRTGAGDASTIAHVVNAHSLAVVGTRRALIDADGDLRLARYMPSFAEQYLASTGDGEPGAFFYLVARPPHVVIELGCYLPPSSRSAAQATLVRLEQRARELAQAAPPDARAVLQCTLLADDGVATDLMAARGFAAVREWVHFELDLSAPPVVTVPDGVVIRPMDPGRDWPAVGATMDEAFADHWGEMGPERRTLLEVEADEDEDEEEEPEESGEAADDPYSNSLGLCFVAEADGQVIGSCLCNARTIEWPASGKLGSLSVLRAYRRRGVAAALTATALAEFHRRGVRRVITDTDSASFTGANRFYPRFGFRPYRYERVYEKELRPGVEWRRLAADTP